MSPIQSASCREMGEFFCKKFIVIWCNFGIILCSNLSIFVLFLLIALAMFQFISVYDTLFLFFRILIVKSINATYMRKSIARGYSTLILCYCNCNVWFAFSFINKEYCYPRLLAQNVDDFVGYFFEVFA